jgi:hypothetical protein
MSQELQELRAALERERAAHAMTTTLLITARVALNSEAEAHIQTRVSQVEALREAFQQSQQVGALEARLRAAEAELEATRAARDAALTALDGAQSALDTVLAARDDAVTWGQYF